MSFLRLPRELRDMIYERYFAVENGYLYDAELEKLTQADNSPISLSLSLTCRQVAREVRGLAFRVNTITFSTLSSSSQRTQVAAGVYHAVLHDLGHRKEIMLRSLVSQLLTRDMVESAVKAYPQFAPVFDGWIPGSDVPILHWIPGSDVPILHKKVFHCGEAPSVWIDFKHHLLDLMSKHPLFVERASAIPRIWVTHRLNRGDRASWRPWFIPTFVHRILDLIPKPPWFIARAPAVPKLWETEYICRATEVNDASPKAWLIPDPTELERLASILNLNLERPFFEPQARFTYSAASIALRFLYTLPDSLRSEIGSITLLENHETVAYAKSHGRGFIELCQSNPKLRVKRVVSLWRNAFPVTPDKRFAYGIVSELYGKIGELNHDAMASIRNDRLLSKHISKAVGAWMAEALALPNLGMPEGSFRLVFEGEPTSPDTPTADAFRVVQRDIAWQCALDTAYSRGMLPKSSWQKRRLQVTYLYEGLSGIIDNLAKEDALISCNFELGPSYDVEKLLEEHSTWTAQDWERNWDTHEQEGFDTAAPLPPWHMLRLHRVFD